jgi:hypothetical protein
MNPNLLQFRHGPPLPFLPSWPTSPLPFATQVGQSPCAAQLACQPSTPAPRWNMCPCYESVFLENRLPFTNAYSAENLPPPLGPYQPARPQPPTRPWPATSPSCKPPSHHPGPPDFIARSAQAAHLATRAFFLLQTKATRPPPPLLATTALPCAAPASPPP